MNTAHRPARRAVIYVRTSGDAPDKVSPEIQQRDCEAYAARQGWTVTKVIVERGKSAAAGKKRPGLDEARSLIKARAADVLLVWALDRLARSTVDFAAIWLELTAHGAEFASLRETFDSSTATGRAMVQLVMVFAELERELARERVLATQDHRRRRGATVQGPPPYGYRRPEPNVLALHPPEADAIRLAADLVLAGSSLREMARLVSEAHPPPEGASSWDYAVLGRILRSPTTTALRRQPDGTLVPGDWPPLLDRSTWRSVQDELDARNGDGASHTNEPRWLCTPVARCGVCQGRVSAAHSSVKGRRYQCLLGHVGIGAEATDEFVTEMLLAALDKPAWSALRARAAAGGEAEGGKRIEALLAQRARLTELWSTGALSDGEYEPGLEAINARLAAEEAATAVPLPDVDDLRRAWSALSVVQRRVVLGAAVEEIVVLPAEGNGRGPARRLVVRWRS